jgi:hypothetical protein
VVARLELERKADGYVDRVRKYKLVVDGEQRGTIGRGETLAVDVAPGEHTVMLKIDWVRSQKLTADVADGETVRLWCEPAARPATGLWYATFGRARYIRLRLA